VASGAARYTTLTSLRWVAFSSPSRGVGLFETERYPVNGSGPVSCVLYTRATSDGGARFEPAGRALARSNCQPGTSYREVGFAGPLELLAAGPQVASSRNMGASWQQVQLPGTLVGLAVRGQRAWALVTRCRAYAARCAVHVIRSEDGGQSWRAAPVQPVVRVMPGLDVRLAQAGADQPLALAPDGGVLLAWPAVTARSAVPYPKTVAVQSLAAGAKHWVSTSVACIPNPFQTALAIASDGARWLACASEPAAGLQLKAVALSRRAGEPWRVTARSCVAGAEHCRGRLSVGGYIGDLYALSSSTAFYAGDRSSLAGTFDGGRSWRVWPQVGSDAAGSLQVTFINAQDGWALAQGVGPGVASSLWRTRDGGRSWSRV
jgi:hypothetical protein